MLLRQVRLSEEGTRVNSRRKGEAELMKGTRGGERQVNSG